MKYHKKYNIRDDPRILHRRIQIISKFLQGKTITAIAKEENCTIKTCKKWIDEYKNFISSKNKPINQNGEIDKDFNLYSAPKGHKLSIPYLVQRYIINKCKNKSTGGKDGVSINFLLSQINNCSKIRKKLKFHGKLSKSTLHRFIKKYFGKPYKYRIRPLIKKEHILKRKEFADYIKNENIKSKEIFFTDEKIFLLDFIPNKQTNQIRLSKEMKYKIRKGDQNAEKILTIEIPKKSKGFMVAGGISHYGLGKLIFCIGTVDSFSYKQALNFYLDDIKRLNDSLYFQQDNAPSHSSKESKEALQSIKRLKFWPPNSPDISPIEKVWSFILRKLEGKKFNDLEDLKKAVLYTWNRVPIDYCKKIMEKFDNDIESLIKNGGNFVKNRSKSSYKSYKLGPNNYQDKIENIIYNKESMEKYFLNKKRNIEKLMKKKSKIINKISSKTFCKNIKGKISKNNRGISSSIIDIVIKEEISPHKIELNELEKKNEKFSNLTADNYFNSLKQTEKEKMISINYNNNEDLESELLTKESDIDDEINEILNRPINRQKEIIRKQIKLLIEEKINELKVKKQRKKRTESTEVFKNKVSDANI